MAEAITIRLDAESRRRLEKLASATARSKAGVAAEAIRAFLDLNDWQIEDTKAAMKEADGRFRDGRGSEQSASVQN